MEGSTRPQFETVMSGADCADPASTAFYLSEDEKSFFDQNGYLGPFALFDASEGPVLARWLNKQMLKYPVLVEPSPKPRGIRRVIAQCQKLQQRFVHREWSFAFARRRSARDPKLWHKSAHFLVPRLLAIATMPQVIHRMQSVLGHDLHLWGCQIMKKKRVSHRWHADVEHLAWRGATIWIGIDNIGPHNTMKVVPGSHLYDFTPQDMRASHGTCLNDDAALLHSLRKVRPEAEIVKIDMVAGQFFLFAGRTWHASHDKTDKQRMAVICQFCPPSERVRQPRNFDPPVEFDAVQPWVMQVSGSDNFKVNHVKAMPAR